MKMKIFYVSNVILGLLINMLFVYRTLAQGCGSSSLTASKSISRSLSSPNYPYDYPSNTNCQWTITAPSGYVVELTFKSFRTESGSGVPICQTRDVLHIYDGMSQFNSKIGVYCGSYLPANVYSSGMSLLLVFESDYSIQDKGFMIDYKAKKPEQNSTICSPYNSQYTNNALKYTGSSGYIKSPLYGTKYPSNIQCRWVIEAPSGFKIKLSFLDMKMTCTTTYASLKIRDGQYYFHSLLGTKCGSSTPSTVYSTGRYMWIQFKSGLYNYYSYNTAGFNAQFEQISSSKTTTTTTTTTTIITESTSQSSTSPVISIIVGVLFLVIIITGVIICIGCVARRRRTAGYVNRVPAPVVQSTATVQSTNHNNPYPAGATPQYPQQVQGGFVPPPPVGYSPAPQGSYPPPSSGYPPPPQGSYQPPPGGYPTPQTGGYPPAQSSISMMPYPTQTIPNEPPPQYPGPPQYPLQGQQQAAPYPGPQGAATQPNPPYPPPQGAEHQQSTPPYPLVQGAVQPTAPPQF